MKLGKNRNWIAVAIGGLALAVAATGTAAAVTSPTTTISDPSVPAQKAHVDSSGRLQTFSANPTSSLASETTFANVGVTVFTSPTTAKIAVTNLLLSETRLNGTANGADLDVSLVQLAVDTNVSCSTSSSITRVLAAVTLSSGQSVQLASAVPYLAQPVSGAKYCLAIRSGTANSVADDTRYFPQVTFNGYVASGSYTGMGANATPAAAPLAKKKIG